MIGNKLDFTVVANNDIFVRLQALNPDDTPVNITGATVKWAASKNGAAVITKSTALGGDGLITLSDPVNGWFTFWLKAADTINLLGQYVHEAVVTDAAGHPVTLANNDRAMTWGTMTVRKQYTVQS